MSRSFIIVIDGLGIGAQEDAADYGDENADTLGHISNITKVRLPNFERLGLGNIKSLASISATENPAGSYGKMRETSAGKDSTTGHWELAGIKLDAPFPTYPNGFPKSVIHQFCEITKTENVLCNLPYSGTDVIRDFGEEHLKTGNAIVYTSADSVFQVACHTDVVSIEKLYEWCEYTRNHICVEDHAVGRVIARPFEGSVGSFSRISDKRHDYSLEAPEPNIISELHHAGVGTYSIGKIVDLFPAAPFTQFRRTKSNAEGISQLLSLMSANINNSFTFVNLIDTDQIYGHRQDTEGYARALEEIDRALPAILEKLKNGDLLIITGDHGNDPADDSTDHTREFVPLIACIKGKSGSNLGIRKTFSDVAATVADYHNIKTMFDADSFLEIAVGTE
jgi:phosphopentomutase